MATKTDSGKALLLRPDMTFEALAWPATQREHLPMMYAAIGCSTVELVRCSRDLDMWIDEEGKFGAEPQVNVVATTMARAYRAIDPRDVIVGNALLTSNRGANTVALSHDQLRDFDRILREI